jgi:phage-related protein
VNSLEDRSKIQDKLVEDVDQLKLHFGNVEVDVDEIKDKIKTMDHSLSDCIHGEEFDDLNDLVNDLSERILK